MPGPGFSRDYRMSAPDLNDEGRLVLRQARHPLLEAILRGEPGLTLAQPGPDLQPPAAGEADELRKSGPSCRSTSTSGFNFGSWS